MTCDVEAIKPACLKDSQIIFSMHEASIARSIIEAVESFMKEKGYEKIKTVNVRIGKMMAVLPDALLFAFDALKGETTLEDAELHIKEIPIKLECTQCGNVFEPDSIRLMCPRCGGIKTDVLAGKELDIESVEVEEETLKS